MEAIEIIAGLGRRYAEIQTYQDVGTLTIKGGSSKQETLLDFKTYFKRPFCFRYESSQSKKVESRFVLWCDGQKVARQNNNHTQQVSQHFVYHNPLKDLDRALSTVPSAQPVACLLLDKLSGQKLTAAKSVKVIGETIHDGAPCYHLQSTHKSDFTDLWISKANLTLLRIVEKTLVAGSEETIKVGSQLNSAKRVPITYEYNFQNIWIDESIPSALFLIPTT